MMRTNLLKYGSLWPSLPMASSDVANDKLEVTIAKLEHKPAEAGQMQEMTSTVGLVASVPLISALKLQRNLVGPPSGMS